MCGRQRDPKSVTRVYVDAKGQKGNLDKILVCRVLTWRSIPLPPPFLNNNELSSKAGKWSQIYYENKIILYPIR